MSTDTLEYIHQCVKNSIYPYRFSIDGWKMKEGENLIPDNINYKKDKNLTSVNLPCHYGVHLKTTWFVNSIIVPDSFNGKPMALLLDLPEALVYLDGKPVYGIDAYHKEIFICEKAKSGQKIDIVIQTYFGKKRENHNFHFAELAIVDVTARMLDSAFHALIELEKNLENNSLESKEVKDLIRRALIFLKYFKPGSEEYPNAIKRAYNFLLNAVNDTYKTKIDKNVFLVGSYFITQHGQNVSQNIASLYARIFATVLKLLSEYPNYKFTQNQSYIYFIIKQQYTELYKQIKQRISEGRWEPLGASWTDFDSIQNGEMFIRQILYGKNFIKKEFDFDVDKMWLPNITNLEPFIPQVLLKANINGLCISKNLEKSNLNLTSFWWQGIDSSKLLTHITPLGISAQMNPKNILESIEESEGQFFPKNIMQTYGNNNGGGGPSKFNLECAEVYKNISGLPHTTLSTINNFFNVVKEEAVQYPDMSGEIKNINPCVHKENTLVQQKLIECEKLLRNTELLSLLSLTKNGNKYPQSDIEMLWKRLMCLQVGVDMLSGLFFESAKAFLQDIDSIKEKCSDIVETCKKSLIKSVEKNKKEIRCSVFNPCGWERNAYIEILVRSKEKYFCIEDVNSNKIEHQIVGQTKKGVIILCYITNIPAYGFKNIFIRPLKKAEYKSEEWRTTAYSIETPYYKMRFNNKGWISSIYAKYLRREMVQKGRYANFITVANDKHQEQNLDIVKTKEDVWKSIKVKIVEKGPLRATLEVEYKTKNNSQIIQKIKLYHKSHKIDFENNVGWCDANSTIKTSFHFNMKNSLLKYDIPFGVDINKKQHADVAKSKIETSSHQWIDLSEEKYGVSILNDFNHYYDLKENVLKIYLFKAFYAEQNCNEVSEPISQNLSFSLLPHDKNWTNAISAIEARELNNNVEVFQNSISTVNDNFIKCSKSNIIVETIKKSEKDNSIIVRLFETNDISCDTTIQLGYPIKQVFECNLFEEDDKQLKVNKNKFSLKFKPFEIKTLKIVLGSAKNKKTDK